MKCRTAALFYTRTHWLKGNDNKTTINVESAEKDPNSILHYVRKMIKLRKDNPVLVYGRYKELDHANELVYAYTREPDNQKVLVLLSFSDNGGTFDIPQGMEMEMK